MRNKYTKALLEPIIKKSINWAQVCRDMGVIPATGSQAHIKRRALGFGINFDHFLGSASNRGKTFFKKPSGFYLKKDGPFINSHALKLRLWSEGIKPKKCENATCGIAGWCGVDLPLELDHINNNHHDNRIENLMILCPNCHAIKTRAARKARVAQR